MRESTQQQLNSIFQIFQEMTEDKLPLYEASTPKFLAKCESISLKLLIVFLFIITVFSASSKILSTSQENKIYFFWILYIPLAFSWLVYITSAVSGLVAIYLRQRKIPGKHGMIMKRIQRNIEEDYDRVVKLKLYPKHLLEYAFMQYKTTWNVMNDRSALIVGDLKKFGLMPALAAAALSASRLIKEDANLMLWLPVAMATCMYLIAFAAMASRERLHYVTETISYVISQSEDKTDAVESNKEPLPPRPDA
ncbi:hypothetical protein [Xanthomonas sp. 3307]|uniref:hypothetical protein n=1 Tax=Xanthomonas sp. 3307 TaxID=3035316 RepID=UPI00160EBCBC|nr:hypothetical protein [Xanthomonas sp. 3307]MBB5941910.1 hypothetical protein [Xanthomonas sp. 3307]